MDVITLNSLVETQCRKCSKQRVQVTAVTSVLYTAQAHHKAGLFIFKLFKHADDPDAIREC